MLRRTDATEAWVQIGWITAMQGPTLEKPSLTKARPAPPRNALMNGIHLSLLIFGGLAVAAPIVLHLIMRQKPQIAIFPALRFVRKQREQNQRQLRIRHWLLLLLRCLAVLMAVATLALANLSVATGFTTNWVVFGILGGLFVLAVVLLIASIMDRSGALTIGVLATLAASLLLALIVTAFWTVRSGGRLKLADQRAPVAAAVVIDTNVRMEYRRDNTTHLERARETAEWIVSQLPSESQIAIVDARPGEPAFSVDDSAALRDIERLRTATVTDTLPRLIDRALRKVESSELPRKEVYVLTDRTEAAWRGANPGLARQLAGSNTLLYVIDVGADALTNFSLGDIRLSSETIAQNGSFSVAVDVRRQGEAGERTVELFLEEFDATLPRDVDGKRQLPQAELRRTETIQLNNDGSGTIAFAPISPDVGAHQGYVQIKGADPLEIDNRRYFSIEVREAWSVLAVAPKNVNSTFFVEAIAPSEFRRTGRNRFRVNTIDQDRLPSTKLNDYDVVCLLDPKPLTPSDWDGLASYVSSGGSLASFLGHNSESSSLSDESAQQLLPGEIRAIPFRSPQRNIFLAPQSARHPIFAPFRDIATTAPWQAFPVFFHWDWKSIRPDTEVIARFSNGKPAILETRLGEGKVITLATPVTDPSPTRGGRSPWNEFAYGENNWPPFIMVNEITRYLASNETGRRNYLAGETAILVNRSDLDPDEYTLFAPGQPPEPKMVVDDRVTVAYTENLGAYRLKGNRGGAVIRGFAVNLPASETNLKRLPRESLDAILGPDNYRFAADRESIERDQSEARAGSSLYPFFLTALVIILAFEYLLANRFYQSTNRSRA